MTTSDERKDTEVKRRVSGYGIICFLAFLCLLVLPCGQSEAHGLFQNHSASALLMLPLKDAQMNLHLSELPIVKPTDPDQELKMILRQEMKRIDRRRLVVAMRLGEKLHMLPDAAPTSGEGAVASVGKRGQESASRFEALIKLTAASFEDEKVIEEPEDWDADVPQVAIADPLEPINRVFFAFNDKLYFWVLRPIAKGYRYAIPEPFRVGFRNMFSNLAMPIRAVNCLLQGKFKGFGRELLRFVVNSTAGFLGFGDAARIGMHLDPQDEDFGQTLGVYGAGPGIYINWPIFGPSSIRDTIGMAGDFFVDPLHYMVSGTRETIAVRGGDKVNRVSLSIGDYESLKKAALDPYVAVRDAYFQYRRAKIEK